MKFNIFFIITLLLFYNEVNSMCARRRAVQTIFCSNDTTFALRIYVRSARPVIGGYGENIFSATISKVFKGNFEKGTTITFIASYFMSEFFSLRKTYIIMGDDINNFSDCSFRLQMSGLSTTARKKIKKNFEHRFPNACGKCEMRPNGPPPSPPYLSIYCPLRHKNSRTILEESQYACVPREDGFCELRN